MLYKKALNDMMSNAVPEYYVCMVCGYIEDGFIPDECPICQAGPDKFKKVE